MPLKRHNFSRDAAAFASQAERQLSQLKNAMKGAEDSLAGLRRSLKVPVPKGGNRYTRRVVSRPSIFVTAGATSVGNLFSSSLLSDFGLSSGSFYSSQTQLTSQLLSQMNSAQRIR